MRRWILAVGILVGWASVLTATPSLAWASSKPSVAVDGAVGNPATYTVDQLAALPQSTVQVSAQTEQGVSLEDLASRAQPALPDAKNAVLRVALTVRGAGPAVTFAVGELDPSFGNHPAVLSVREDGVPLAAPRLVVPGDRSPARFVDRVRSIAVGVESPSPTTPPGGGLDLVAGGPVVSLDAAWLHALPQQTVSVSFKSGIGQEHHAEQGPSLLMVLRAAHVPAPLDSWIAAVGSDRYVAVVTPGEQLAGGRQLLVSTVEDGAPLAQPRLVVNGDVKGGRYVSQLVDLAVGRPVQS